MPHCNKKMISFFLTTKCNLICKYCYNASERSAIEEQTLSFEIAKAGIDWYFTNNESRHIRFYGPGEPTREFDLMKRITNYACSHPNSGQRVTVEVQTNGIFSHNVADWISENVNILWLSFDGTREIQDYYRPLNPKYNKEFGNMTTSEILEDNINWFKNKKNNKTLMIGARVTITEKNVNKQIELIDYFQSLGIHHVWTDPLFRPVGRTPTYVDQKKTDLFHFDFDAYVDNYIDAYHYASSKQMFWGSFFAINFDGESSYHCRSCMPLAAPHLTTDGYISACDMALLGETPYHMSPFIVGKWNNDLHRFDFFYDKIYALNGRKSTEMEHCLNCRVKLHCGGCCLGETVNEFGDLYGQDSKKCEAICRLYDAIGIQKPYPYLHP